MTLAARITDLAVAVRAKINLIVPRLIPPGGSTGQIVTKTGSEDYAFGWADAPAGGGGAPGGVSGQVQFNNGGAFAGAADLRVEGGQLRLPAISTPVAPAAGGIKLFGRNIAGRVMPAIIGPSGQDATLAPHPGTNRVAKWQAVGNGTNASSEGMSTTNVGTATTANVAVTNVHTRARRIEYLVTTASALAIAAWRALGTMFTTGGVSAGGFHYVAYWGPATGVSVTTSRGFSGMFSSGTNPGDAEPSSRTNIIGMAWDAADANIQMMHNDGTGTATKIDLGAAFPVPTVDRAAWYRVSLFSTLGATPSVSYEVLDVGTGAVATGTITTDLPSASTLLAPYTMLSVGGTSSVVGIAMGQVYIETDN